MPKVPTKGGNDIDLYLVLTPTDDLAGPVTHVAIQPQVRAARGIALTPDVLFASNSVKKEADRLRAHSGP